MIFMLKILNNKYTISPYIPHGYFVFFHDLDWSVDNFGFNFEGGLCEYDGDRLIITLPNQCKSTILSMIEIVDGRLVDLIGEEVFSEESVLDDEILCENECSLFIRNTAENIKKYKLDLTEFRKYNLSDEYIYLNPSGKYKSCTGIEKDKIQSGEVGGTTMWISKYCLARLEELKKSKESYDDVVLRLLELVDGK